METPVDQGPVTLIGAIEKATREDRTLIIPMPTEYQFGLDAAYISTVLNGMINEHRDMPLRKMISVLTMVPFGSVSETIIHGNHPKWRPVADALTVYREKHQVITSYLDGMSRNNKHPLSRFVL